MRFYYPFKLGMGLLPFRFIIKKIPPEAKYVMITSEFNNLNATSLPHNMLLCGHAELALQSEIRKHRPLATVVSVVQ